MTTTKPARFAPAVDHNYRLPTPKDQVNVPYPPPTQPAPAPGEDTSQVTVGDQSDNFRAE